MTDTTPNSTSKEVALIVGGGPGISASCARLFVHEGMSVAIAARDPDKPVLVDLENTLGVARHACDAADPNAVAELFVGVTNDMGAPRLIVHNIDGRVPEIFRKGITEADPELALQTVKNAAFSAFLVAQQGATQMLAREPDENGHRGTIIFTSASAALKGIPKAERSRWRVTRRVAWLKVSPESSCRKAFTLRRCPLMRPSGGPARMAHVSIASLEQPSTTMWPTLTVSPKSTFSFTGNIVRPGRSKSF